ncbi:SDR family oxidoreductase [Paraburkholderia sp. DHOC27]|nr:SDR family oxidoreductase [Paraburkholderia sp. DHOC27]
MSPVRARETGQSVELAERQPADKPVVLITGVSTGIGRDCAQLLIRHGYCVIGTLRRQADAEALQAELGADFLPLLMDVCDIEALPRAVAQTQSWLGTQRLVALVNNAGVASPNGPLAHQPLAEVRAIFEVNVFGLLALTQAFLPLLGARQGATGRGRIINISSGAGAMVTPLAGAYAASKHALEAMSDALRRELCFYGIAVSAIEPGAIRTPLWDKSQSNLSYATTDYAQPMQKLHAMLRGFNQTAAPVESVSRVVLRALRASRPKARYPLSRMWFVSRWLPVRWVDRMLTRRLGLDALSSGQNSRL